MKRLGMAVLMLGVLAGVVSADRILFDIAETVGAPTAQRVRWQISLIDAEAKKLQVDYQWLDGGGNPISVGGTYDQRWVCRDIPTPGTNAECTSATLPYPCCTGFGTGTCDGFDDTCFSDIFSFAVRAQDVGTPIGVGLRTLIFNQWKADILQAPGNDGTFE